MERRAVKGASVDCPDSRGATCEEEAGFERRRFSTLVGVSIRVSGRGGASGSDSARVLITRSHFGQRTALPRCSS